MQGTSGGRKNIYLVGFMGTGKTTIGKELAKMMGRKFLDLDEEIEKVHHQTVAQIFEQHGEKVFRQSEEDVALQISGSNNRVVATGGGSILNPKILEAFEGSGLVVCLYTNQKDLVDRLKRTDKRPLLKGQTPEEVNEKVEKLLRDRAAVYNKVPHRLDTSDLTPLQAARKIHEVFSIYRVRDALAGVLDLT